MEAASIPCRHPVTSKDARFSSGRRDDNGAAITETEIIQDGHQITTVERILSNRAKIIKYTIEVAGPGEQRGHLEIDLQGRVVLMEVAAHEDSMASGPFLSVTLSVSAFTQRIWTDKAEIRSS